MKLMNAGIALATLALTTTLAHAHFDVEPYVVDGKIITGGYDHGSSNPVTEPNITVFGYDFGPEENPFRPYNVTDPGFNATASSGLTGGSVLSIAVTSNLLYWDGTGEINFSAALSGMTLTLENPNVTTATITGTGVSYTTILSSITGVPVANIASNGTLHVHLTTGIYFEGAQTDIPLGIYAFEAVVLSSDGLSSDPIWFVYNNQMSEEIHDAAIEYFESVAVPEPASLAMLGLGATALLSARRKR